MSENREAVVHEDEMAAIKDSRQRDMSLFNAVQDTSGRTLWVVAISEHQAKLALVDRVWPMEKRSKRERDERYTRLLELECEKNQPEPETIAVVGSV